MLRKLVLKGVKSDKQWAAAYQALVGRSHDVTPSTKVYGIRILNGYMEVHSRTVLFIFAQ